MNYVMTKKGLFRDRFIYVDTKEYDVDKILVQEKVKGISFGLEFRSKEYPEYAIVMARVPKHNSAKFIKALEKFEKTMLLQGKSTYLKCCEAVVGIMENATTS